MSENPETMNEHFDNPGYVDMTGNTTSGEKNHNPTTTTNEYVEMNPSIGTNTGLNGTDANDVIIEPSRNLGRKKTHTTRNAAIVTAVILIFVIVAIIAGILVYALDKDESEASKAKLSDKNAVIPPKIVVDHKSSTQTVPKLPVKPTKQPPTKFSSISPKDKERQPTTDPSIEATTRIPAKSTSTKPTTNVSTQSMTTQPTTSFSTQATSKQPTTRLSTKSTSTQPTASFSIQPTSTQANGSTKQSIIISSIQPTNPTTYNTTSLERLTLEATTTPENESTPSEIKRTETSTPVTTTTDGAGPLSARTSPSWLSTITIATRQRTSTLEDTTSDDEDMISGSIDSGSGSGGTDYSGSYGTDSPPPVTASLCNDEYVIHPGVLIDITSPNYPLLYADNLQCTWGVSTSSGKPIIVEFKFLALETGYDFLVILDIVGAIQKQYTGGRIPAPFISAGSQIRLQMMTDDSIHFGGFRVTAREFEEPIATTRASPSSRITRVSDIERTLSTTINTASVGMTTPSNAGCERHYNLAVNDVIYITSPNFPDYYTNDLNCLWTFATVDGATLSVNLVYFETEDLYDYVDGGTGSPLNGSIYIDRYSGTYHNHPVMLPSSRGWISFTSDSAYREHGFNISVTALGTDEEAQVTTASNTPSPCNAVYTISFGGSVNVTSPNFPNNYPDGVKCEWQVSTLSGKRIMVVFHNLSLQLHQDYLYISDGDDIRIVKLYTGNEIPLSPFISNSSYIHMIFDASSTGNDTGFWVTAMETEESPSLPPTPFRPNTEVTDSTVSTGDLPVSTTTNSISCSGHYDVSVDRVHIISSPNYPNNYDNSLNCLWTFSAVDGALIRIVFITFGTEEGYDVLFVGEGDPNTGTTDYFLSGSVLPTDISSTTSSLWVKFQSDASVTAIGFKFAVVAVTGEGKK